MVVESPDAHDDHGLDDHRNVDCTKDVPETVQGPPRPRHVPARLFSLVR